MPNFSRRSTEADRLRPAVFTRLLPLLRQLPEPPLPLHIGDTYLSPPEAARLTSVCTAEDPSWYRYSSPAGELPLREAFCERWSALGRRGLSVDHVHVTLGATGAVQAAMRVFCSPGDDVLILAPFWPLVRGIALSCGANPVEVSFYDQIRQGVSATQLLESAKTDKTTTVYMCSPNNPDGTVLSADQLNEVAQFCIKHDLWLISDEAYCDHVFAPAKRQFIANLPGMAERVASTYTASKSYALAGLRLGFLVGAPQWLEYSRRVSTHQVYNVPMATQQAVQGAIEHGHDWLQQSRDKYAQAAKLVHDNLNASFHHAQGAGYVFCDLREDLGDKSTLQWIAELLHEGVSIAPGAAFGSAYEKWVRVCYMSLPPDQLMIAIDRLNQSLHRIRKGEPFDGPRIELQLSLGGQS
ncbi:MAG TPA: hypothetical protein DCQ06_13795 [Myxococcales bacterium]|nr:hypothetical protein [Myxococcales bacterium]